MKKRLFYIIIALAAVALGGCTDDSYTGGITTTVEEEPVAIYFGAGSSRTHTRADLTGAAAADALNHFFNVYGVKTVDATLHTVYPTYTVEYDGTDGAGAAGSTQTNSSGWEYVGLTSHPNQTLHYWDYSATNYTFQAWSPTTGNATVDVDAYNELTVIATSAQELSNLYIADLVSIDKSAAADNGGNRYGSVVTFTFRNMATKVRLGIYETIPGYSVSKVTFRSRGARFADSGSNALLDGAFNGYDSNAGGTYKVTYNTTSGRAMLDYTTSAVPATFFDFGTFTQGVIGTESSNPTWAGGSGSYLNVLPNEDHSGDMTLYIDFTLTADDGSDDVIRISGAHVTVPASYMVWHPNFAYTYLFKISKDVNGTTGEEGVDPEKLYPITFNAIVKEFEEATAESVVIDVN